MNAVIERKARVIAAIKRIREALVQRQLSHQDSSVAESLETGVVLCDEMELRILNSELNLEGRSLFRRFDRYAVDSMPWDEELWRTIADARQEVCSCL